MYARRDIPTVLPDAVLRCRKLQAAANVEFDEMEKSKVRRINNLEWQQQSFQKTITEKHKRWRMYDRAFRLKLKRELGADLAAALRMRTLQDEEEKYIFEQNLIEQSLSNQKKDQVKHDEKQEKVNTDAVKSISARADFKQEKVSADKRTQSATNPRRSTSAATKISHPKSATRDTPKLLSRRPRTSRFDTQNRRDTDPNIGMKHDFGSVLLRILSNIAATPDLDDDFTIRKRAMEARERRLIRSRDDRFFNLVNQLSPNKIPGEKDTDDSSVEDDQQK